MARIAKAAIQGSWQAAAWILERRFPDDFGKVNKYNIKSENKNINDIKVIVRNAEDIEKEVLDKLERIRNKPAEFN
jgi:hypothetical protein